MGLTERASSSSGKAQSTLLRCASYGIFFALLFSVWSLLVDLGDSKQHLLFLLQRTWGKPSHSH